MYRLKASLVTWYCELSLMVFYCYSQWFYTVVAVRAKKSPAKSPRSEGNRNNCALAYALTPMAAAALKRAKAIKAGAVQSSSQSGQIFNQISRWLEGTALPCPLDSPLTVWFIYKIKWTSVWFSRQKITPTTNFHTQYSYVTHFVLFLQPNRQG